MGGGILPIAFKNGKIYFEINDYDVAKEVFQEIIDYIDRTQLEIK